MKFAEFKALVEAHREEIEATMQECYESVIDANGVNQFAIYLWDNGEIKVLEDVQGGNSFLVPHEGYDHELFRLIDIAVPCFDWRDYCSEKVPDKEDDPEAYEALREDMIQWLKEDYNPSDVLDEQLEYLADRFDR